MRTRSIKAVQPELEATSKKMILFFKVEDASVEDAEKNLEVGNTKKMDNFKSFSDVLMKPDYSNSKCR